nr:MAG: hypothetical protein [Bacteriophage sp.]
MLKVRVLLVKLSQPVISLLSHLALEMVIPSGIRQPLQAESVGVVISAAINFFINLPGVKLQVARVFRRDWLISWGSSHWLQSP